MLTCIKTNTRLNSYGIKRIYLISVLLLFLAHPLCAEELEGGDTDAAKVQAAKVLAAKDPEIITIDDLPIEPPANETLLESKSSLTLNATNNVGTPGGQMMPGY